MRAARIARQRKVDGRGSNQAGTGIDIEENPLLGFHMTGRRQDSEISIPLLGTMLLELCLWIDTEKCMQRVRFLKPRVGLGCKTLIVEPQRIDRQCHRRRTLRGGRRPLSQAIADGRTMQSFPTTRLLIATEGSRGNATVTFCWADARIGPALGWVC